MNDLNEEQFITLFGFHTIYYDFILLNTN